ncbi:hypothetical protein KW797_04445, partial [Candidatus Parcubacteria bacterium]|nr:hypothetical protein [Candidatus Parcubacteria bacterium]
MMGGSPAAESVLKPERRHARLPEFEVRINQNSMVNVPAEAALELFGRPPSQRRRKEDRHRRWYATVFPVTEISFLIGVSFTTVRRENVHYTVVVPRKDEIELNGGQ